MRIEAPACGMAGLLLAWARPTVSSSQVHPTRFMSFNGDRIAENPGPPGGCGEGPEGAQGEGGGQPRCTLEDDPLRGKKCKALNHFCALCTPGYRSCAECADDTATGGYRYTMGEDSTCSLAVGRGFDFERLLSLAGNKVAIVPSSYVRRTDEYAGFVAAVQGQYDKQWARAANATVAGVPAAANTRIKFEPNLRTFTIAAPERTTFTVRSMYLRQAWRDGLEVTLTANMTGGALVRRSATVALRAHTALFVEVDWENVNALVVASEGGADGYYLGINDGVALVVDGIYTAPEPPEPEFEYAF